MEEIILIALAVFLLFSACILPWINHTRLNQMRRELEILRGGVPAWKLEALLATRAEATVPKEPQPEPLPKHVATPLPETTIVRAKSAKPSKPKRSFEEQFGQRLPVWIGAIALALGGFFLVRYSIEHILVTPLLRVISGLLLGGGLLVAANRLRTMPSFVDISRITQAMSGAGIVILYLSIVAATRLYELLPHSLGFMAMMGITALAVVQALRQGAPIALIGLTGGFLSPALIGSPDASTPLFFLYLYVLSTGLMVVIRQKNWWWLGVPMLLGAFGWTLAWLGKDFVPGESVFLGLFLLAISATLAHMLPTQESKRFSAISILRYAGLGGTLMLSALVASRGGFALSDWGMYGALSLGALALAWFKPLPNGFLPFAAFGLNLLMLSFWSSADHSEFILVVAGFAALFSGGAYLMLQRCAAPLLFAALSAGAALAYFLLAYYRLHEVVQMEDIPLLWGTLAVLLAAAATCAAAEVKDRFANHTDGNRLLAIYAAAATAFIALALGIELKREFFSVAIAGEMLALAWIGHRLSLATLRPLVMALAMVFGFLLLPQLLLLTQLTVYSLSEMELALQETVPLVAWPAFQLGLPAAMFLLAAWLMRRQVDGRMVHALEYAAIALVGIMGYYQMRHAFHVDADVLFVKAGFVERGTITNTLFLYGLGCLIAGRIYTRKAFSYSGIMLCAAALFRIAYFDMLLYNPAFAAQDVPGVVLFNALLLPFGLPLLWTALALRELPDFPRIKSLFSISCLLMLFWLLTLNVRLLFHGDMMHSGTISNAEIYTYSAVWLLMGIGLLVMGTLKVNRFIRSASLAVMILTVCKVFLYDASELEGLYRVFSFLGLGASLLGLSWFYTRFVFTGKQQQAETSLPA